MHVLMGMEARGKAPQERVWGVVTCNVSHTVSKYEPLEALLPVSSALSIIGVTKNCIESQLLPGRSMLYKVLFNTTLCIEAAFLEMIFQAIFNCFRPACPP